MEHFAAILIVVILILMQLSAGNQLREDFLTGYWVADNTYFCDDSGIDTMMLYIGEQKGFISSSRECYLIITPDDIANDNFTMSYWRSISWSNYTVNYNTVHICSKNEDFIWNGKKIKLQFDVISGRLTLKDAETCELLADLTKQNDLTNSYSC